MALTKPILAKVPAWDVGVGQTFTFDVIGGDQFVGSTLTIVNNQTGVVVYTKTQTSFRSEIVVPPNASGLANGVYYSAYVTTTNAGGDVSPASNSIQFYCYSTPTWGFTNISQGGIVPNSTFVPEVNYNQSEGELLSSYVITLYDAFQTQIATSGVNYISSSTLPLSLTYTFTGLEDNTQYYVKAEGVTVEGSVLDSGFIRFTVRYTNPSGYSKFTLENNCQEGYITYTSNVAVIEGEADPPPIFIGNTIDLRGIGAYARWDNGFEVDGDFTLKAWLSQPNLNSDLITLNNEYGEDIILGIRQSGNGKIYADLLVGGEYYIYSNSIDASSQYCIQVRRINNIYDIYLEVV